LVLCSQMHLNWLPLPTPPRKKKKKEGQARWFYKWVSPYIPDVQGTCPRFACYFKILKQESLPTSFMQLTQPQQSSQTRQYKNSPEDSLAKV
jgi:hypothetical protein